MSEPKRGDEEAREAQPPLTTEAGRTHTGTGTSGVPRMPGDWVCDQCGALNTEQQFPCTQCRYPLFELEDAHRQEAGVFEGRHSSVSVEPNAQNPHAGSRGRPRDAGPPQREPTTPIERTFAQLSVEEKEGLAAPVPHLNWQCPVCYVIGAEAPCVCCGYDPDTTELPVLAAAEAQEEAEEEERSLYEQQLAAGTKIVEVTHGAQAGPIPLRSGGFRFRVWAPNAQRVFVMGDFNSWKERDQACEMRKETNLTHWRIDIPAARTGHRYAFLVKFRQPDKEYMNMKDMTRHRPSRKDRFVWREDPRAPMLVSCHEHRRRHFYSVLYDHSEFPWTDGDFIPPPINKLVLYELHVASFSKADGQDHGTFASTTARLDYLKSLGINAIALMPITHDDHPNEHHNMPCWGYDPISLFAIHPSYGTPNDLKLLVNTAHELGMVVVFDSVFNHMHSRSILQFWDGTNLYFEQEGTEWGPRPRFTSHGVQDYIIDSIVSFFRDYHMDGVRVDSTSNVRGQGSDIPGGWQLLQRINDVVHENFPRAFTIAEDLYDDRRLNTGGACFDLQWCQGTFKALFNVAEPTKDARRNIGELAQHISRSHPGHMGGRVLYTENHDTAPGDREKRIPLAIVHGDEKSVGSFYAVMRTTLVASIMFCTPGVPMLLQGQEIFECASPEWPVGPTVDWKRIYEFPGVNLVFRALIALRQNQHDNTLGLTGPYVRVHHLNESDGVMAIHRWAKGGPGDDVMVVANFSNKKFSSYRVGFPREGRWSVRLSTSQAAYNDGHHDTSIDVPEHINVTTHHPRDGYPFSGAIALSRYTAIFLSQNGEARLVFRVKQETEWGTSVGISGSDPALGSWTRAIELRTDTADAHYPWWQSDPVVVPARTELSYKMVLLRNDEIVHWEDRDDRTICPPIGRVRLILS
ncbi:hypothetical protein PTSG_02082 [Salpingoeca rosetta]|uniref:1,4-alpha-glucan branching enzyme n=1 Tax=Salpingoeca rosetta (strain ATCC 50818 / BSB-021) TaxID=946362 RepID=F2U2K8_SALR5|nr:uncharacterized protein PTSG_02082 [Salpingoeca rosetta]EGD81363.1 hypothetical protein PTSG_02082 [Salpingoeca rosetta]|eukprot:XP_004996567.1 hypothetical protein PTSG_02082 [Salpingoeca rosetta]